MYFDGGLYKGLKSSRKGSRTIAVENYQQKVN